MNLLKCRVSVSRERLIQVLAEEQCEVTYQPVQRTLRILSPGLDRYLLKHLPLHAQRHVLFTSFWERFEIRLSPEEEGDQHELRLIYGERWHLMVHLIFSILVLTEAFLGPGHSFAQTCVALSFANILPIAISITGAWRFQSRLEAAIAAQSMAPS